MKQTERERAEGGKEGEERARGSRQEGKQVTKDTAATDKGQLVFSSRTFCVPWMGAQCCSSCNFSG